MRTREISGLLLLQYEGANFFEGATTKTVRSYELADAGWLQSSEQIDLSDLLAAQNKGLNCWPTTAVQMRFIGRRKIGISGHMGMWESRYEIDELLDMEVLPWPECESPYDWGHADG